MGEAGGRIGADLVRLIGADSLAANLGSLLGICVCVFCGLMFGRVRMGEVGSGFRLECSRDSLVASGAGGRARSSLAFAGCRTSWVRGISL